MPRPIGGGHSFAFDRSSGPKTMDKPQFDQQGGGGNNTGGCKGRGGGQPPQGDSFQSSSSGQVVTGQAGDQQVPGGKRHGGGWRRNHQPAGQQGADVPGPAPAPAPAPSPSPFQGTIENPVAKTGDSNGITDAEIDKATGGDAALSATLKKIAQDPEGAKVLRDALNKGTTYKQEKQEPGRGGVTVWGTGMNPKVSIDPSGTGNISILAHESAHAAYPEMNHTDVYNTGYRISDNLGVKEPRLPGYENIQ